MEPREIDSNVSIGSISGGLKVVGDRLLTLRAIVTVIWNRIVTVESHGVWVKGKVLYWIRAHSKLEKSVPKYIM